MYFTRSNAGFSVILHSEISRDDFYKLNVES